MASKGVLGTKYLFSYRESTSVEPNGTCILYHNLEFKFQLSVKCMGIAEIDFAGHFYSVLSIQNLILNPTVLGLKMRSKNGRIRPFQKVFVTKDC